MPRKSALRQFVFWLGVATVFVIAGMILARSPRIDLGWRTNRRTAEYRRHVRSAMHAATESGAIHSIDVKRGIMRINANSWDEQDVPMRQSLMRLAARYFEVQGRPRKVTVKSAYSNNILARYDGAEHFTFVNKNEN